MLDIFIWVLKTQRLSVYYHFPNSVTLRFSEQAKIFTRRCPNRKWLDLQNQWNLHIKQKANQYTDQSYPECVWCVFLQNFTKHVDSEMAPKTRAIVNIDVLCYINNACMSQCTFKSNFLCTVFLTEVCILFTTKLCSTHIKCDWSLYCLVCIWYANFIEIEDRRRLRYHS